MAPTMIKEDTHHVADFRTARTRQRQRPEPQLDLARANVSQPVAAPSRNDPLAQIAFIAQLGGVRFPSTVWGKLTLRVVISQLRESDGLSFAANVRHVDVAAQRASCAYGCIFVPKLDDRSDDYSAVFAPAIWPGLSPSVFPNVWTALTLASHDAAVMHGLNLRLHFGSRDGAICAAQAQSRHKFLEQRFGGSQRNRAFSSVLLLSRRDDAYGPNDHIGRK